MTNVQIPEAYSDLFTPSRYKAYHGGRGGAKSHSFATALVLRAIQKPELILCCREIQASIKASSKQLIDNKIQEMGAGHLFKSLDTEIRGINGSRFTFAGLRSNPESIKSMEGITFAWVEEADKVSQRSINLLIPTIRAENSEIWFSWNPVNEFDPVDMMFRGKTPPPDSIVRQVNFTENPFFPEVLKQEAEHMRLTDPDQYNHVWLGGYRQTAEGAYYARQINDAIAEGRITHVPHQAEHPVHLVFDLGMDDSTTVWMYQTVGREVQIIDYYESRYTSITDDMIAISRNPYLIGTVFLPHDGKAKQKSSGKTTQEVVEGLGYKTQIVPSISVMDGISAVRSTFNRFWFAGDKCALGLKAVRAYHEEFDETLRIGKGPKHDWSSHAADALRYLALSLDMARNNASSNGLNAMRDYIYS